MYLFQIHIFIALLPVEHSYFLLFVLFFIFVCFWQRKVRQQVRLFIKKRPVKHPKQYF